jgi:hypothetical protein
MNIRKTISEIYDSSDDSEGEDNSFEEGKISDIPSKYKKTFTHLKDKYSKYCSIVKKTSGSSCSYYRREYISINKEENLFGLNSTKDLSSTQLKPIQL